jgi:hypothetical protein
VHNFVSVAVISSFLSGGVEGTVSFFQYVKRIADGIASICIGPHLSVYHAKQNISWVKNNAKLFKLNIVSYFKSAIPLFLAAILCMLIIGWIVINFYPSYIHNYSSFDVFAYLFLLLLLWQMIISLETVAVGVLVMENLSAILFIVNVIFILNLILIMNVVNKPYSTLTVATACVICQIVSLILSSYFSFRKFKTKFA